MAKIGTQTYTPKHTTRKGQHSKNKQSRNKNSKNYSKRYRGQGRP